MTGGQWMVVLIVAIVMFASIIKSKHSPRRRERSGTEGTEGAIESGQTQRLREEVKQLKERLAVLERITVEKENSLEREIERLRDR
ncbi:MAG: hypothetical protein AVDCRST_MAG91-2535 [uncultured Sphingomonadaceae bacterium]|uniref:Phage shock protein B n=1 Tax=uncultured Sphingomonadaceae bacterium TaxID=169976 RepID=A0A6J4TLD5_9SPHN|nr:MAG: hypothetical protein AVDCRST_MAG91-2535 [uncultured Sphingomonadaceae bacterium]